MTKLDPIIKKLDILPIVQHYISELGLYELFEEHIPNTNGCDINPSQVLCVMIMNIVAAAKPLYKVDDWLLDYVDGQSEQADNSGKYNDDRLGRTLDKLFEADRNVLMSKAAVAAIKVHELQTERIHNDSTTVSFAGAYSSQNSDAVNITYGHNKDHRPDYKQIVFGLNITEDGHVPLTYQLFDGNQADVTTHIPNWNGLREFLEKEDFVYVADSKLCSVDNLHHIDVNEGTFITLVPKNRNETKDFYDRLRQGEEIYWEEAYSHQHSRKKDKLVKYSTYDEATTWEGYRIVWVHSSSKDARDGNSRICRIKKAEKELEELSGKLNKYQLKSWEQIDKAINSTCKGIGEFLPVEIIENKTVEQIKVGPGRPGPNSIYKEKECISYAVKWYRDEEAIERAEASDGVFPLVTNSSLPAVEVLKIYKKQPFLEKRFYAKKTILEVAPVFLEKNERVEAMMFLYFIALMIVSLIERNIRAEMEGQKVESLRILPSGMKTKTPTFANIRYFFRSLYLGLIKKGDKVIRTTVKGITEKHVLVLRLLKVPRYVYDNLKDGWWNFAHQQPL